MVEWFFYAISSITTGLVVGGGIVAISHIVHKKARLKENEEKEEKEKEAEEEAEFTKIHKQIGTLIKGQQVLLYDRIKDITDKAIEEEEISFYDRKNLVKMYEAYQEHGGNGAFSKRMPKIDKFPEKEDREV